MITNTILVFAAMSWIGLVVHLPGKSKAQAVPVATQLVLELGFHATNLDGAIWENNRVELYNAVLDADQGTPKINTDSGSSYELEYLIDQNTSIKVPCRVSKAIAWQPKNDGDLAHLWFARVPTCKQGIGFLIRKNGQLVAQEIFPKLPSLKIDSSEPTVTVFAWVIHSNNGQVAISWDQGKTWHSNPSLRSTSGSYQLPTSSLRANPNPWFLLQASQNGVITTKLHIYGRHHGPT